MRILTSILLVLLLSGACSESSPAPEPAPAQDTAIVPGQDTVAPLPDTTEAPDTKEPSSSHCPVGVLTISPTEPTTADQLTANLSSPDRASGDLTYSWSRVSETGAHTVLAQGATLPSSLTAKGDRLEASASSSLDPDCPAITTVVVIQNTAPALAAVTLSPSAAYVTQTLQCGFSPGAWLDPDPEDPVGQVSTRWFVNGAQLPTAVDTQLTDGFAQGDVVHCELTPNDGDDDGPPVLSNEIPILNSPPESLSVDMHCGAPEEPVRCTATGLDADGDTPSFLFHWYNGLGDCGSALAIQSPEGAVSGVNGSTLSPTPLKGTTVFCCATAIDAQGLEGAPVASSACTLKNAAPTVTGALVVNAEISQPIQVSSTLACQAIASDADGDALSTECLWKVGGEALDTTACSLSEGFLKGQSVCCQMSASDGEASTLSEAKACATVEDTPPIIEDLLLTPASGDHCEPVDCAGVAFDADGDPTHVLYSWIVDGQPLPSPPPSAPNQQITCTATPIADGVAGSAVTASVTLTNHTPALAGISLEAQPEPAVTHSTLTCTPTGWSDQDACDNPTYKTTWYVNGVPLEDATGHTLSTGAFVTGDTVLCLVAPGDGYIFGTPVQSAVLSIANSAPAATTVTVTPPVGNHHTLFTCITDGSDADNDPVEWTYRWMRNGELLPDLSEATAEGVSFAENGALLKCAATPFDGQIKGSEVLSNNAAVLVNAAPSATQTAITPSLPSTIDDLVCSTTLQDPEGDPTTVSYEWFRVSPEGSVLIPNQAGAQLSATHTSHFDTLYCRATPHDGQASGTADLSPSVVIANTAPSLENVQLQPAGGTPQTIFECIASGYEDVDADPETISYTWLLNGEAIPNAEETTIQPAAHGATVGDDLSCQATPWDGNLPGTAIQSNPVVLSACAAGEEGSACNDGNACTTEDTCVTGGCVGTPISCDDTNPCTSDTCSPNAGCQFLAVALPCEDGNPCTEDDSCVAKECVGQPVPCADGNPCTLDDCHPTTGCLHYPSLGDCDDNNPCTLNDQCSNSVCVPGVPDPCDDGNACTDDSCAPASGCAHTPGLGPCDDGNPCTAPDICVDLACLPGGITDCNDGNPCTADGCDPESGCTTAPNAAGTPCSDGQVCTTEDTCEEGTCQGGPPPNCDDQNPCTADACVSDLGCTHTAQDGICPGGALCKDGQCCTGDCSQKVCGDDGCGASCGACTPLTECLEPDGVCSGSLTEGMVLIPSGPFWMGCNEALDNDCAFDESPYHTVQLAAFEIDLTETPVADYTECVDAAVCEPGAIHPSGCVWGGDNVSERPINCVDWYNAETYCNWSGKRLCTEAEWEKASRGTSGQLYPWGSGMATCSLAIMKENGQVGCGLPSPWPVGVLSAGASPYGALDMSGNVSEWVADWYYEAYYANSPTESPTGAGFGLYKSYRGGDYYSLPLQLRASKRWALQPDNLSAAVGIRCCKNFP